MAVTKTYTAPCPECDTVIRFTERPDLHELVVCPECDTDLEVVQLSPVKLDWAYDDEWDDEDVECEDDEEYEAYDDDDDYEDEDW